jgi:hypothetical protein
LSLNALFFHQRRGKREAAEDERKKLAAKRGTGTLPGGREEFFVGFQNATTYALSEYGFVKVHEKADFFGEA